MAVVQGVKEKVHLPIYDCLTIKAGEQWRDVERNSVIKFFIDVQGKTKLETNLQSASQLPHFNTFEARAMRVVISDLPPEFSDERTITIDELPVVDNSGVEQGTVTLERSVSAVMDLLDEARESEEGFAEIPADDEDLSNPSGNGITVAANTVRVSIADIEAALADADVGPPPEQVRPNNGAGTLVGRLVYNTVTTFYVGEKEMIRMPTWFFPAGAGPYSETGRFTTHGEPSPVATFRFAEPIYIDKQQNFRVELEVPDNAELRRIHRIYGPLRLWVVLDGYMTRDVQ